MSLDVLFRICGLGLEEETFHIVCPWNRGHTELQERLQDIRPTFTTSDLSAVAPI